MATFSLANFYPCGSYKLTMDKEESTGCTLYKNMSQSGVNRARLDTLYSQGYIDSGGELSGTIEKFINIRDIENINIIVLLLIIFIYILIRLM